MAIRSKWFFHQNRLFEARDVRVMTRYQIWIYEDGRPLHQHSTVGLNEVVAGIAAGRDVLAHALDAAAEDIQSGKFETTGPHAVAAAE